MGNDSWQRSVDKATGKDAGYAPHRHAYARADWQFARERLVSAQLNFVGGRERSGRRAQARGGLHDA